MLSSRHMFVVDYKDGKWSTPTIKPFENFSINPMNMTLHYSISCFEGLKAYKTATGGIRMFRPDENMKRFNSSLARLGMQGFDDIELIKCIE